MRRDKKHIKKVIIKFMTQPSQSDCDLPAYTRDLGHCSACCNLSIKSFLAVTNSKMEHYNSVDRGIW